MPENMLSQTQRQEISDSLEAFKKKRKELSDEIMNIVDQFALERYVRDNRPKTPNGVDICPKCEIIGMYTPPVSIPPLSNVYQCEFCEYKPGLELPEK
jgi:hypothetical protein